MMWWVLAPLALAQDAVLLFEPQLNLDFTNFETSALAAGASRVDHESTLPDDLSDYLMVALITPNSAPTPEQLKLLAAYGGQLAIVSEGTAYYEDYDFANRYLEGLGYGTRFVEGELDRGCTSYGEVVEPTHPLVDGVPNVVYAYSSNLDPSGDFELLIEGVSGQTLMGVEGSLILMTDSELFTSDCAGSDGNAILAENLVMICSDSDGDGETRIECGGGDCDDADATINPDAVEVPDDGIDQDCDGADAISCFEDADGDGFGGESTILGSGECADGAVSNSDDCDDSDAGVAPGATEIPDDGVDQDCDGVDAASCYVDDDGDGYGAGEVVVVEEGDCAAVLMVSVDGDCEPLDSSVYPGATEIPGDGVDQDCDGMDAAASDTGEPDTASEAGDTGGEGGEDKGGCSCNSAAPASSAAWGLLLLLTALRRRRLDASARSR